MLKRCAYLLILLVLLTPLVAACGESKPQVRIGSQDYTEVFILGHMYQMLLADAGFDAVYKPLGGTAENHRALTANEIDLYPEYTGTA